MIELGNITGKHCRFINILIHRKDAKLAKKPFNKSLECLCVLCAYAVNNPGLN